MVDGKKVLTYGAVASFLLILVGAGVKAGDIISAIENLQLKLKDIGTMKPGNKALRFWIDLEIGNDTAESFSGNLERITLVENNTDLVVGIPRERRVNIEAFSATTVRIDFEIYYNELIPEIDPTNVNIVAIGMQAWNQIRNTSTKMLEVRVSKLGYDYTHTLPLDELL